MQTRFSLLDWWFYYQIQLENLFSFLGFLFGGTVPPSFESLPQFLWKNQGLLKYLFEFSPNWSSCKRKKKKSTWKQKSFKILPSIRRLWWRVDVWIRIIFFQLSVLVYDISSTTSAADRVGSTHPQVDRDRWHEKRCSNLGERVKGDALREAGHKQWIFVTCPWEKRPEGRDCEKQILTLLRKKDAQKFGILKDGAKTQSDSEIVNRYNQRSNKYSFISILKWLCFQISPPAKKSNKRRR